jgi:hypothetical protein
MSEAEQTVNLLIEAFEKTDIEIHKRIWFRDQSLKVYGLYTGNNISGWESLKQHFERTAEKINDIKLEVLYSQLNFNSELNTAWFSLLANENYLINGKQRTINGIRYTGVMERIEGEWRIVQFHGSVPLSVELD